MNIHGFGPVDRRTAEQLLDRGASGIPGGHPPLAALLAAAAVPGRPHELAREPATIAAFRTATLHPTPQARRRSVIKTAVTKVITIKTLTVVATTTVGGVALAASTGALPSPLAQPAPPASSGLSAADPSVTRSGAGHRPVAGASKDPKGEAGAASATATTPSPALAGLCHAYDAGNKADRGKAVENPAFTALISTAGGKDKVEEFCRTTLATPGPSSSPAPSSSPSPSDKKADKKPGKARRSSVPTELPTVVPTDQSKQPSATRNPWPLPPR
jgi:hypothetical protein